MKDINPLVEVEFYKSSLCPRCRMTAKVVERLQSCFPNMSLSVIEVTRQPLLCWQKGIRMIPAIRVKEEILSGLMLGEERIRPFLEKHVGSTPNNTASKPD